MTKDKQLKKLENLRQKAIKYKKLSMKAIDDIYEIDEIFGEGVLDEVNDEKYMRS